MNEAIKNGPNRKIGFLSSANYESVKGYLDENAEPKYFGDTTEITIAVFEGDVLAGNQSSIFVQLLGSNIAMYFMFPGLVSGLPDSEVGIFNTFPSEVISPRAFQMKQGDDSRDLLKAVDAAVVRTQISGQLLQAEQNNPPFQVILRLDL